jgi:hypothetical protein
MTTVRELRLGSPVYATDGRELGMVVGNNANDLSIDFSQHTPIRQMYRLKKERLDLDRHTLPLLLTNARSILSTPVLVLDPEEHRRT